MKILLTPLGMSPGLLYSALCLVQPDALALLTSATAIEKLDEIFALTNQPLYIESIIMEDPFKFSADTIAIAERLEKFADTIAPAREWVINITGGTTAMQYCLQGIQKQLELHAEKVTVVALVDKRSRDNQTIEPYVVGKIEYL